MGSGLAGFLLHVGAGHTASDRPVPGLWLGSDLQRGQALSLRPRGLVLNVPGQTSPSGCPLAAHGLSGSRSEDGGAEPPVQNALNSPALAPEPACDRQNCRLLQGSQGCRRSLGVQGPVLPTPMVPTLCGGSSLLLPPPAVMGLQVEARGHAPASRCGKGRGRRRWCWLWELNH